MFAVCVCDLILCTIDMYCTVGVHVCTLVHEAALIKVMPTMMQCASDVFKVTESTH